MTILRLNSNLISFSSKMPTKLFVGNIQCESSPETEDDLKRLFSKYGPVTECDILTGKSYGFVVCILFTSL